MKIVTYYKTLELEECQEINFDYDKAMITFFIGGFVERFYFKSEDMAIDFMHEIMEGIYSGCPIVDVSYITAIPSQLSIIPFMDEVKERIKNHKTIYDENVIGLRVAP